jgi:DASH complex subunit DAD2
LNRACQVSRFQLRIEQETKDELWRKAHSKMSYSSRPLPSHLRQPSTSGNANSAPTGQSQVLLARINEKKLELENLRQLRDLSAGLAGQMSVLEEKLATLADGTEGIHCI